MASPLSCCCRSCWRWGHATTGAPAPLDESFNDNAAAWVLVADDICGAAYPLVGTARAEIAGGRLLLESENHGPIVTASCAHARLVDDRAFGGDVAELSVAVRCSWASGHNVSMVLSVGVGDRLCTIYLGRLPGRRDALVSFVARPGEAGLRIDGELIDPSRSWEYTTLATTGGLAVEFAADTGGDAGGRLSHASLEVDSLTIHAIAVPE